MKPFFIFCFFPFFRQIAKRKVLVFCSQCFAYYTTTRENRELRHAKDIPDRTEDYTTTRENWELRLMLLNLTRIVESVLASSEDSVEQELRRLELEFEKLQMD